MNSKAGFTTIEMMIALAVTAVLGLGGAYFMSSLEKSKYQMSTQTDYLALEKIIEGYLLSPRGCAALNSASIDTEISFSINNSSDLVYGKGKIFGNIEITGFKILNFTPVDPDSSSGIAQIELKMLKINASRGARRLIPVSVNMVNGMVQDCNFSQTRQFNQIKNRACAETYNFLPVTMSCDEVALALRNAAVEEICKDIYGAKAAGVLIGGGSKYCDFTRIHGGKDCGAQFIQGFAADGSLECRPKAYAPPPACSSWGAWYNAETTVCSGQAFTQKRDCLVGITAQQTRTGTGTGAITYSYNPGPPENYCPSQNISRTNNCTGTTSNIAGTSTDPSCSCVTTWLPVASADDICTGSSVTQTDSCNGSNTQVVNGTKVCAKGGASCTIKYPHAWKGKPNNCRTLQTSGNLVLADSEEAELTSNYVYGGVGKPGGQYMMEGEKHVKCSNGTIEIIDETCFQSQ